MRIIFFIIGIIIFILFIVQWIRGGKYSNILIGLSGKEFYLKSLYKVGIAWDMGKLLRLKGNKEFQLKSQAALIYESEFSDYYAHIFWIQAITVGHLMLSLTFIIGSLFSLFVLILLMFITCFMVWNSINYMKKILDRRKEDCESELATVVSTMAILTSSGMMLREAWIRIAQSGEGVIYELMRKTVENMKNGYTDSDAIFLFGKSSNSIKIKKFTGALLQSMERGGGELSIFFAQQSSELWSQKRQYMLQQGEKAAAKLLIPIALIFLGIIIIVITTGFSSALF